MGGVATDGRRPSDVRRPTRRTARRGIAARSRCTRCRSSLALVAVGPARRVTGRIVAEGVRAPCSTAASARPAGGAARWPRPPRCCSSPSARSSPAGPGCQHRPGGPAAVGAAVAPTFVATRISGPVASGRRARSPGWSAARCGPASPPCCVLAQRARGDHARCCSCSSPPGHGLRAHRARSCCSTPIPTSPTGPDQRPARPVDPASATIRVFGNEFPLVGARRRSSWPSRWASCCTAR